MPYIGLLDYVDSHWLANSEIGIRTRSTARWLRLGIDLVAQMAVNCILLSIKYPKHANLQGKHNYLIHCL